MKWTQKLYATVSLLDVRLWGKSRHSCVERDVWRSIFSEWKDREAETLLKQNVLEEIKALLRTTLQGELTPASDYARITRS